MTRRQSAGEWFGREVEESRHTPEFELEWLLLDVTEQLHKAMTAQSLTRAQLAERLGTSRAFVTKLLSGHENVTLKTLVRVANALGVTLRLRVVSRERAPGPSRAHTGVRARPRSTPRSKPRAVAARSRTPTGEQPR